MMIKKAHVSSWGRLGPTIAQPLDVQIDRQIEAIVIAAKNIRVDEDDLRARIEELINLAREYYMGLGGTR